MKVDGYFNSRNEPVIKLIFGSLSIEALVDTGFDGSLIMPIDFASNLDLQLKGLQFKGLEDLYSPTGEKIVAKTYSMRMPWLGRTTPVFVMTHPEFSEAILGSHMLKDCRLTIDYRQRTVTIVR